MFVCHCLPGPWQWLAQKSKQISPGKTNKIISYFGNAAAHRYFCSVCFETNCETYQTTNSMKINFALLLSIKLCTVDVKEKPCLSKVENHISNYSLHYFCIRKNWVLFWTRIDITIHHTPTYHQTVHLNRVVTRFKMEGQTNLSISCNFPSHFSWKIDCSGNMLKWRISCFIYTELENINDKRNAPNQ